MKTESCLASARLDCSPKAIRHLLRMDADGHSHKRHDLFRQDNDSVRRVCFRRLLHMPNPHRITHHALRDADPISVNVLFRQGAYLPTPETAKRSQNDRRIERRTAFNVREQYLYIRITRSVHRGLWRAREGYCRSMTAGILDGSRQ